MLNLQLPTLRAMQSHSVLDWEFSESGDTIQITTSNARNLTVSRRCLRQRHYAYLFDDQGECWLLDWDEGDQHANIWYLSY